MASLPALNATKLSNQSRVFYIIIYYPIRNNCFLPCDLCTGLQLNSDPRVVKIYAHIYICTSAQYAQYCSIHCSDLI